jgi:hypothetical protein
MGTEKMSEINEILSYEKLNDNYPPPQILFGSQQLPQDMLTEVVLYHMEVDLTAHPLMSGIKLGPCVGVGGYLFEELMTPRTVKYVVHRDYEAIVIGEPTQLSPLHWAARLRSELIAFSHKKDNWDSDGAKAAISETLKNANRMLEALISFAIKGGLKTYPTLVLLPDGAIRFEWVNKDKELFLTVLADTIEAQRWHPLSAIESEYFENISFKELYGEMAWLSA